MQLLDRVRRTIRRHALASPSTQVVAAVSGGPDSIALAHLLSGLSQAGDLRLAGLAHFNHQLRPEAADDERLVREVAAALAVPFVSDRADVAALAAAGRQSLEVAARGARLAFLERARLLWGADAVAFGHTRDDQAETLLLRLVRGAGSAGLGGMHPKRGVIIRPLLECRRSDLRAYLDSRGLPFNTDVSNADVSIPRNRVRAELIPLLERRFNPAIVNALADEAALLRDEQAWLSEQVSEWLSLNADRDRRSVRIPVAALLDAPAALARAAVHQAMKGMARGRPVAYGHAAAALDLARRRGPAFEGPRQSVQRIGGDIVLTSRSGRSAGDSAPPQANLFEYPLSIPGETRLDGSGMVVSAQLSQERQPGGADESSVGYVQVPPESRPLRVRLRRPGDRFQPLGMTGRKSLQDFFVDRKVARDRRARIPIVVDATDRIVWVAGHRIGHMFRVQDPSQPVIILRLKAVGGSD